eukprot:TRINITY_DN7643_c0_g1_i1.p1 TRINITY_DN7643_c0_g1~~TRINITY_DN7643_c0_g1_i1.p1  ORF type:complete len:1005 (+),score=97.26 TRINITY_DN7643_c0_g1_i1:468-3482(+)
MLSSTYVAPQLGSLFVENQPTKNIPPPPNLVAIDQQALLNAHAFVDSHAMCKYWLESSLLQPARKLPKTVIVRTTTIGPAVRFPSHGHANNLNPLTCLAGLVCTGHTTRMLGNASFPIDIAPVDVVVTQLLALATQAQQSLSFFHVATSDCHPMSWGSMAHYMMNFFSTNSKTIQAVLKSPRAAVEPTQSPTLSIFPTQSQSAWSIFPLINVKHSGHLPPLLAQQMCNSVEKLELFLSKELVVSTDRTRDLLIGYKTFPVLLPDQIDWETYIKQACVTAIKHLGGQDTHLLRVAREFSGQALLQNGPVRHGARGLLPSLCPDLYFSSKAWRGPNGTAVPSTPGLTPQTKAHILSRPNVIAAIAAIEDTEVSQEAERILDRIGDNLSPNTLRPFAFTMRKVLRTLYHEISVNEEASSRIWEAFHGSSSKRCVVFIPTHRSYMDFLVLSYVLYAYAFPLPHICAGEDFLKMVGISRVLRNSGAFFMRRSFQGDQMYTEIFREFIRCLVHQGECIEFFIEGTRSRAGKSLPPKHGILKMIVDAFCDRGEDINDVIIIPVSLSYDQTLEATIYSREMQGATKPKETLNNLLRSASILQHRFGAINVNIGDGISLCALAKDPYLYDPSYEGNLPIPEKCGPGSDWFLRRLGWVVSFKNQMGLVASPSALLASVLLHLYTMPTLVSGLSKAAIRADLEWIRDMVISRGGDLRSWRDSPIYELCEFATHMLGGCVQQVPFRDLLHVANIEQAFYLTLFANPISYLFAADAVILCSAFSLISHTVPRPVTRTVADHGLRAVDIHKLKLQALFLRSLMATEFFEFAETCPLTGEQWFQRTVSGLVQRNLAVIPGAQVGNGLETIAIRICYETHFLTQVIAPFVETYWLVAVCSTVLARRQTTESAIVRSTSELGEQFRRLDLAHYVQVSNVEVIRNGFAHHRQLGMLVLRNGKLRLSEEMAADGATLFRTHIARLNALRWQPADDEQLTRVLARAERALMHEGEPLVYMASKI